MAKITEHDKKTMRILFEKHKSYIKVARIMNIDASVVNYHINPRTRRMAIDRARRYSKKHYIKGDVWSQKNPEKRRKYQREYFNKRYHEDPEFRKRMLQANLKYQKRKRDERKVNKL
jgi:hypothetical protein